MGARFRFRILGRTGLLIGDRFDDRWGRPKLRGLLAALLLNPGREVTLDTLVEWMWSEDKVPRQRSTTMYTYASRVRDFLDQMDQTPQLVGAGGAYRIEIDKSDVDYFAFRDLVDQARQRSREGDHAAARDLLRTAVDLWSERPLADLDGDRADRWRRWAETELLIPAHSDLLRELAALGEFDEALRRLDELPVEYQQNLTLVQRRIEVLFGLHRAREATTYFLAARKRLLADFDEAEAAELTRFYDGFLRPRSGSTDPPAVPTPRRGPSYLPHDIPDFVGRESLLHQLGEIIPTTTSITVLEGPPGVGKSALAVHWAHLTSDRFPDGQFYLNLNGFSDTPKIEPSAAVERLLVQLDYPTERTTTNEARSAKLRGLLAGRHALVLLDNASSTEHVQPLVELLPCTVVITSRRHLSGLSSRGARIVAVPTLSYPDGRELMVRRLGARAVAEPAALSALTGLCGGNTLELRLVTEHVARRPHVRLSEFVEELHDEHALLDLGDDEDNPGGSTRATFAMSYQALGADEQRLFRLLGIHPGPDISMDAAAALMGADRPWVKRRLDALVDAHLLIQAEQRARYRLHDLLRKYAAECAALEQHRDERREAEQRMLSYYHHGAHNADLKIFANRFDLPTQRVAKNVTPPEFYDDRAALDWLVRERANLISVIHLAISRNMHEYITIMSSSVGEVYQRLGYSVDVLFLLRTAVNSAKASGNLLGQAYSLNNLGYVELNLRHYASARSSLRAADALFREIGLAHVSAATMINLARLDIAEGDLPTGIAGYRAALAVLSTSDEPKAPWLEITARYRLAEAYRLSKNLDEAIVSASEAARMAERSGEERGQALSLAELAAVYYAGNDLVAAKGYCIRSMDLNRRHPESELAGRNWHMLGQIHLQGGDLRRAERCFRAATSGYRDARDPRGEAMAYDLLASVLDAQARTDEAVGAWSKALALFEDVNMSDARVDAIRLRLAELAIVLPTQISEPTRPLTSHVTSYSSVLRSPRRAT